MGKTLVYEVAFSTGKDNADQSAVVQVIDGYSTFGDIPKIIAIVRGLDAGIIRVHSLTLRDIRENPT